MNLQFASGLVNNNKSEKFLNHWSKFDHDWREHDADHCHQFDEDVQRRAAWAIEKIGGAEVVRPFLKALGYEL